MSSSAPDAKNVRRLERDRLVEAVERRGGVATRQELDYEGFSHRSVAEAVKLMLLVRSARGLYRLPSGAPYGEAALGSAALLFPQSVVALISALSHHSLTTQIAATVDLAVPRRYVREVGDLEIRQVVMPMRLLADGVERVRGDGFARYRVFSRARSVCDAFRYLNLVGEDVAYEALRNYVNDDRFDAKELVRAAKITGTTAIVIPVVKTLQVS